MKAMESELPDLDRQRADIDRTAGLSILKVSLVRLVLPVSLCLVAAGCREQSGASADSVSASPVPPPAVTSLGERAFDTARVVRATLGCSPDTLAANDTLVLVMSAPHGQYLGAVTPAGDWFFIVFPEGADPSLRSHMPSVAFRDLPVLRLPASVQAQPWQAGRTAHEPLFVAPGEYVMKLGEGLESDVGWPIAECRVVYRPTSE